MKILTNKTYKELIKKEAILDYAVSKRYWFSEYEFVFNLLSDLLIFHDGYGKEIGNARRDFEEKLKDEFVSRKDYEKKLNELDEARRVIDFLLSRHL